MGYEGEWENTNMYKEIIQEPIAHHPLPSMTIVKKKENLYGNIKNRISDGQRHEEIDSQEVGISRILNGHIE